MAGCFSLLVLAAVGDAQSVATAIDYAQSSRRDDWLRHPVYGDPSFDTFERATGNPIHRGTPPMEWPVNGFFFDDPVTGHWFVYVGLYAKGYAMGPDHGMDCAAYRSKDRGRSWEHLGPVFPAAPFYFAGDTSPVGYAPDVSIVYADGRYHMVYDYATANSTWETAMNPANGAENGIGYAWSEHPEGPYHRTVEPVYRTSAHAPLLGKYRRGYAATLLRRKHDWLVLAMSDSGPNMSWALMGMTASNPEGPYSAPVLLRCVDELTYHPPLLEFYPAFQHDGRIYAPATSVALNRNFQAVFRVKTEDAMKPDAWELFQHGSVWHAAPVENEAYGIWGQTFTGFVDRTNTFHVMYPSRDPQGMGTINLAARHWKRPHHNGFTASAHEGSSLALLRKAYGEFALDTEFELHGAASFVFGYQAPLGPNKPAADATLHPLSLTRYNALELTPDAWRVVRVDEHGNRSIITEQTRAQAPPRKILLRRSAEGRLEVALDGAPAWSGDFAVADGLIGLVLAPHSHIAVKRYEVRGHAQPARIAYLATDAILGAGEANGAWKLLDDTGFRYGSGATSNHPAARAKWNVEGSAITLWAPKGPEYGAADLYIDGQLAGAIDFSAPQIEPSRPLFSPERLKGLRHAVTLVAKGKTIPLDVLEVEQ